MTAATPPDPTALPQHQKAELLSGQDSWSTRPVEAAGLPSVALTDGPHGVRLQVGDLDEIGLIAAAQAAR